jgi:serine/threonine-protein kinase
MSPNGPIRVVGRYELHDEIASGGMATVHFGRLATEVGFSRTVAIKRLHAQFAKDPAFVAMFVDEARLASRIRHPNVVPMLDVVALDGEVFLVMEYIPGESLAQLWRKGPIPVDISVAIATQVLEGLHSAHEATSERGEPLHIVHRDVSPQNVMIGVDGIARLLDFGVAKAASRLHTTRDGEIKGKLAYMSPEQIRDEPLDRRVDIYAASVVLWEMLTGVRLFAADNYGALVDKVQSAQVSPPSRHNPDVPKPLDEVILKGLAGDRSKRFPTARAMAAELERVTTPATIRDVSAWVERSARDAVVRRASVVTRIESGNEGTAILSPPQALGPDAIPTIVDSPITSLSAVTPSRRRSRERTPAWLPWVAAGLAALGVSLFVLHKNASLDSRDAAGAASVEPPPASALVPTAARSVAASPSAFSGESAPDAGTRSTRPATRGSSARPRPDRSSPECNPPYTIRDNVKRYKPQCLY